MQAEDMFDCFSIIDFRISIYTCRPLTADRRPLPADPSSLRSSGQAADRRPPTAAR